MRVLQIATSAARFEGDYHSPWIVELMQRLQARGVETELLAPSFKGLGDHRIYGMHFYRFRYAPAQWETLTHESGAPNRLQKNPLLYLLIVPYLLSGMARTLALVRKNRYDVIHIHWPLPQIIFGLAAKFLFHTRLVSTSYGADMRMAKRIAPARWVLRWMMRRADALIGQSPITMREIEEVTGRKARLVEYWITSAQVPTSVTPPKRGATNHLLAVGRMIERKGYEYLVRALPLIAKDLNVHLTMVGAGQELERVQELSRELNVADRVTWLSGITDEELARLYGECNVFVHPSIIDRGGDTESVGTVLMEAMSHARPIVATNVGGIPDVIQDGVTGLLVPEKNPQAFADAITRVLCDDELAHRLGTAARKVIQAQVDWDKSVDQIVRIYAGENTP
ncbi:MAG: glycosyltransferase family 4 protein [Chloroflexi bacterium]|nr:glycosyltransferase family 4 protein [Chloroflexota bacterium]